MAQPEHRLVRYRKYIARLIHTIQPFLPKSVTQLLTKTITLKNIFQLDEGQKWEG
jgi:hypothetical protein